MHPSLQLVMGINHLTQLTGDIFRMYAYVAYLIVGGMLCILCTVAYIVLAKEKSLNVSLKKLLPFQPVLLAFGSSIPATQSLIMSKCIAMMMLQTLARKSQLHSWFFWVSALIIILSTVLWAAVTTHGIARFPTIIIVPILQVCYEFFARC
jgi:hypothetical protein